jgi:hypothetical protein
MEAWRELCDAAGVDPAGLAEPVDDYRLLHAVRACEGVDGQPKVYDWLACAMNWIDQPQGFDWWSALHWGIKNHASDVRVGPGGLRQAVRMAIASRL